MLWEFWEPKAPLHHEHRSEISHFGCTPPSLHWHVTCYISGLLHGTVSMTDTFIWNSIAIDDFIVKVLFSPLPGLILLLTSVSEKPSPTTARPRSSSSLLLLQKLQFFIRLKTVSSLLDHVDYPASLFTVFFIHMNFRKKKKSYI